MIRRSNSLFSSHVFIDCPQWNLKHEIILNEIEIDVLVEPPKLSKLSHTFDPINPFSVYLFSLFLNPFSRNIIIHSS